jgi:hypothetical protein
MQIEKTADLADVWFILTWILSLAPQVSPLLTTKGTSISLFSRSVQQPKPSIAQFQSQSSGVRPPQ